MQSSPTWQCWYANLGCFGWYETTSSYWRSSFLVFHHGIIYTCSGGGMLLRKSFQRTKEKLPSLLFFFSFFFFFSFSRDGVFALQVAAQWQIILTVPWNSRSPQASQAARSTGACHFLKETCHREQWATLAFVNW